MIKDQLTTIFMKPVQELPLISAHHIGYKIDVIPSKAVFFIRNVKTNENLLIHWDAKFRMSTGYTILPCGSIEQLATCNDRIQTAIKDHMVKTTIEPLFTRTVLSSLCLKTSKFAQGLLSSMQEGRTLTENQLQYVYKTRDNLLTKMLAQDKRYLYRYINLIAENKPEQELIFKQPKTLSVPTPINQIQLLPTTQHKAFAYPFAEFNPVQSLVLPFASKDCNIVISANTSSGKTICAELIADHVLEEGIPGKPSAKKVIYTSPLKSLSTEKYEEWTQTRYKDKTIIMLTGDTLTSGPAREKLMKACNTADIIICTSELLDSCTRNKPSEKLAWMDEVGLLIVDESHLLGAEQRGHACEVGIMRFTKFYPHARMLFLSATVSNIDHLIEWCDLLNGKKTELVYTDWRPVPLEMIYIQHIKQGNYNDIVNHKLALAMEQVLSRPIEKFLIFCHDKATGNKMLYLLKSNGIESAFHNGDLPASQRAEIEKSFKDKDGMRVLVATSTLAWGSVAQDTLITKSNGSKIKASSLHPGMDILSYNEITHSIEQDVVIQSELYYPEDEYVITLEDDTEIVVDAKHPIYVNRDGILMEIEAAELYITDDIVKIQDIFPAIKHTLTLA